MHHVHDPEEEYLKNPYPCTIHYYIIGAMTVIFAGFATYEFTKSAAPACPTPLLPEQSEDMGNVCYKPLRAP